MKVCFEVVLNIFKELNFRILLAKMSSFIWSYCALVVIHF